MYYDKNYSQYPNVIEFFSPIIYLDGRNTYNFIRSSVFYKQGKGFKNKRYMNDLRINFGELSESVCLKNNVGFTTKSGVLKCLRLLQLNILHNGNEEFTPIIKNEKLVVYSFCYSIDGVALKLAAEFDNTSKKDVGWTVIVDLDFFKKHDSQDPKMLKTLLVTQGVVGYIKTADSKLWEFNEYVHTACKEISSAQNLHFKNESSKM